MESMSQLDPALILRYIKGGAKKVSTPGEDAF
jgi:hypothetical protein